MNHAAEASAWLKVSHDPHQPHSASTRHSSQLGARRRLMRGAKLSIVVHPLRGSPVKKCVWIEQIIDLAATPALVAFALKSRMDARLVIRYAALIYGRE